MSAVSIRTDAPNVATTREWGRLSPRRSWEAAARKFAKNNGLAIVFRADDAAVIFSRVAGDVRKKTLPASKVNWRHG